MGCAVSIGFLAFIITSWSPLGDVYSHIQRTSLKQCRAVIEKIQTDTLAGRRTYKKVGRNLFLHLANECVPCRDFEGDSVRFAKNFAKLERKLVGLLHRQPITRLFTPKSESEYEEKIILSTLRNGTFRFFAHDDYHLYPRPDAPAVRNWSQYYLDKYGSLQNLTLTHSDLQREFDDVVGLRVLLRNAKRYGEHNKTNRRYSSLVRQLADTQRAIAILHPKGKAAFRSKQPDEPI